jgi:hypothetical protein
MPAWAAPTFIRSLAAALVFLIFASFAAAQDAPLKIAVYDAPPYGHVEPDGAIDGVSVELWRRAAESPGRQYHLASVAQMEDLLRGLERKDYDAAIGAITITPARLARVDFSYPTHRSGAAVAKALSSPPIWRSLCRRQLAQKTARRGAGRDHRKPGVAPDRGRLFWRGAIVIPAPASEPPRRRRAQGRWRRATTRIAQGTGLRTAMRRRLRPRLRRRRRSARESSAAGPGSP